MENIDSPSHPTSTEALAKEAYEFAKKLEILTEESFADFISEEDIEKINEREKETKEAYPKARKFLAEKLDEEHLEEWEMMYHKNVRKMELGLIILDVAKSKGKAFEMDWRWSAEDMLGKLKKLVPELQISFESENVDEENQTNKVVLGVAGLKVTKDIPLDNPYELINLINENLPKSYEGQKFIEYDTGGDSYGFLLVDKDFIETAKDNKFLKIRNP